MANNVLELRGKRFVQAARSGQPGGANMNSQRDVAVSNLDLLRNKIDQIKHFWLKESRPFSGVLISVHYCKIVAKSNRIAGLLKGVNSNAAVVGAKFNDDKTKHIITYYLSISDLEKTIRLLESAKEILIEHYNGSIDKESFDDAAIIRRIKFENSVISKSLFKQVIADVSYIENFEVDLADRKNSESIVTLFDTNMDVRKLLKGLGIDIINSRVLGDQTVFLNENELNVLYEKAPYLVSMATEDLSEMSPSDFIDDFSDVLMSIPNPDGEPTIGVIDTLFDSRVYFSTWVEYHQMIDPEIPIESKDFRHGTGVSSIIVDGPKLNPWLDDGCGRFRVRHFGIATGGNFSSFTIIKKIREIVSSNLDIKVWNISLGSNQEINDNFISAEAAVLDQIQFQYDVIFVIAGTNKTVPDIEKIGSPADSINGIIVNSVTKQGLSTNYSRRGIALSFFAKPDVSYYGGSEEQYITVCEPLGEAKVSGTSYAAPWIARKLSYLIDILGLNRELAKAMIIDSAKGWNDKPTPEQISLYGHGTVPIRIEDIVQTADDEIKFLVTDVSEKWNSYNYSFPVPLTENKYPYVARATMCYFPTCNRAQGVDYTNTELNIHFGRIKDDGKIKDIKGDRQNEDEVSLEDRFLLLEGDARSNFRKWDNVKYIAEVPKPNKQMKKSYQNNKNWGMEVKTTNRLDPKDGEGIRFGVVVTLKEITGVNRIDEFIRNCNLNGWIVNQLDIQVKQDIFQTLNEEINFE
ncbi:S8 family peptidase [Enterococcus faecalis]|uniref:S8 family peptidase n=1 Tax=Enterococcus faecalis TaxID=1351 RepID=UPI001143D314|nr:S8 family peptidase [Enterococcus faecalis]NSV55502.1 S8 family peptidase [Enterococcus faecalis]NSV67926.1 S8 family peptidase [Enterococcus faecalis]NSV69293.1 S8 family peptidase [Enterococcus faecalis]NSV90267.1 S8 family peptidase [Enterococcus faecalis]NSV99978.1 S8 family peptidase [Enterococcus faecalis]